MLIRHLRRGLRLLTMLAIIISVLVACNTGDTPIAIRPIDSHSDPSISTFDSDPLANLLPNAFGTHLSSSLSAVSLLHPNVQILAADLKRPYGLILDGSSWVLARYGYSLG